MPSSRPRPSAVLPLLAALVLAACGERTAAPQGPAQPGVLLVITEPGDARILIDGQDRGNTPAEPGQALELRLPEGSYTLEAHKGLDEYNEWYARHAPLQIDDKPLPAITLVLGRRLTPAGEKARETEQARLQLREEALVAGFDMDDRGTATDTRTGLMWMRCSLGQNWSGAQCSGEATQLSWTQAMKAAEATSFADMHDWRLPTREELHAITYCSSGRRFALDHEGSGGACEGNYRRPTILEAVFPNTPVSKFWSGSPHPVYSHSAWGVSFANGVIGAGSKVDYVAVRLVREAR